MTASRPLAAFDLDGTVLRGQSGSGWAWHLVGHGLIAPHVALRVAVLLIRYRQGAALDYDRLAQELLGGFRGRPIARFEALLDGFVADRLLPQVRREARTIMVELAASGTHVILASAALEPIVAKIAQHLPVEGWIATRLAPAEDGRFSGRLDGPVRHGRAKLDAVISYADARLGTWHLAQAFSDHQSDLALLEAARHPVAVNPSRQLRRIARERGWPVAVWR